MESALNMDTDEENIPVSEENIPVSEEIITMPQFTYMDPVLSKSIQVNLKPKMKTRSTQTYEVSDTFRDVGQ